MKARVRFKKYGAMVYVSHLDMMRYFRKALRRAQIRVSFTEGFSPHMAMSFASPLSTGFSSTGEYFDIGLKEPVQSEKAIELLNKEMAQGIEVLSFLQIPEEKKMGGAALLAACDYLAGFVSGSDLTENLAAITESFFARPQIFALKKSKRSEEVVDIKPLIYKMEARGEDVFMRLAAGSLSSLNPETVMKALCEYAKIPCENTDFKFCRLEMYAEMNEDGVKTFVPLEKFGRQIIDK